MWLKRLLLLDFILNFVLVNGIDYLHLIDHYEHVEPLHIGEHSRNKRDLSTKYYNNHLEETKFQISGLNKKFIIRITKNRELLPSSYSCSFQDNDNDASSNGVENCYYHGKIEGREDSSVVLSTCNGLRGLIEDSDGESYFIEPTQSNNSHIFFNMKDLKHDKEISCGVNHTNANEHFHSHIQDNFKTLKDHIRKRRSVNSRKYIETVAVIDNRKFKALGSNKITAEQHAIELMNYVDAIYKTMNTRVALIKVVVWNKMDMISISANAREILGEFKQYTSDVLNGREKIYPDNAQLITGVDFTGSLVGLAGIGVMCSLTSCAVNQDHHSNPAVSANTIAHEMGHNLGFYHNGKDCICPKSPCVMGGVAPSSQVKSFTNCVSSAYATLEAAGEYPCLYDYPDKLFAKASCGNGYLEEGETCDCGTEADCKAAGVDGCCDYTTCKLRSSAQCADGTCCDNCKFKVQGSLCRTKKHSECDLEEFCVGNSAECPRNFHVKDGASCANGQAICHQGLCKTHTSQCEALWGADAMKAHDKCFDFNKDGDEFGNCGIDLRDQNIKCKSENVLCGKIQCQAKPTKTLPRYPLLGTNRKIGKKFVAGISCTRVSMDFPPELDDPTLVTEGVKCAENSICMENKCKNISQTSNARKCKRECQNGGVCNNNGNCHCPAGFACPYCELAGPGGSLDSGQGCLLQEDCECLTPLVKGLLVLFLLVIPLFCLIAYLMYNHKEQIGSRWRVYRQSKRGESDARTKTKFIAGKDANTQLHMGGKEHPPSNPYATSSHQGPISRGAPARQPPPVPSYRQNEKTFQTIPQSSGKMRPPPKVPPIGSSSPRAPGKLPQINAYNQMDSKANNDSKLPPVQIKGKPYR